MPYTIKKLNLGCTIRFIIHFLPYHSWVFPTPGAPQISVVFPTGTPPPRALSRAEQNVTMLPTACSWCRRSRAVRLSVAALCWWGWPSSLNICSTSTASSCEIPASVNQTSTDITKWDYMYFSSSLWLWGSKKGTLVLSSNPNKTWWVNTFAELKRTHVNQVWRLLETRVDELHLHWGRQGEAGHSPVHFTSADTDKNQAEMPF